MKKIAFLGMGTMGAAMAANLSRANRDVRVWNRTPATPGVDLAISAGCTNCLSISDAVVDADFVMVCVSDVGDVEQVLFGNDGVSRHAKKNALVIDFSTISPEASRRFALALKAWDIRYLDAPVTGGDIAAKDGTLTTMVGSEPRDFESAIDLLRIVSSKVVECGHVGSGQALKLVNQVLCGIHMVALSEALFVAAELNVDPQLVIEVCATGAGDSWALRHLGARATEDDFSTGFGIGLMRKDLGLVLRSAGELPGVKLASKLFELTQRELSTSLSAATQAMVRLYQLDRVESNCSMVYPSTKQPYLG